MDRREFLKISALASTGSLVLPQSAPAHTTETKQIAIRMLAAASLKMRLATRELISGLRMLNGMPEVIQTSDDHITNATLLTLVLDSSRFKGIEDYEIAASGDGTIFHAASEQALLYAVFDFLERQGIVFGIDGTTAPLDPSTGLHLPAPGQPWTGSPPVSVRGLLPPAGFFIFIHVFSWGRFWGY